MTGARKQNPCTGCTGPRRSRCRDCQNEWRRNYRRGLRIKGPPLTSEQLREHRLATWQKYARNRNLRAYGITQEQWDAQLARQGGRCAICGTDTPNGPGKTWATDHDHETGKFRGLICANCNLMLGHAHDDPERLRKAAAYIETHRREDSNVSKS